MGVLLLDEILLLSVTDAMALKGIFSALWARGVTVICTSSTKQHELYANNQEFDAWLPELAESCPQFDFTIFKAPNHRLTDLEIDLGRFVSPINEESAAKLAQIQKDLMGTNEIVKDAVFEIPGEGRSKTVPFSGICADGSKFAQFDFADLFEAPLGRAIFSALAIEYDHLFIMNAPQLHGEENAAFRRFYTFVDLVYGKKGNIYIQANVDAADIYAEPSEASIVDHQAWRRNRELLNEMRTPKYEILHWLARNHMVQATASKAVQ